MANPVSVLIIEDQTILLDSLAKSIDAEGGFEVRGALTRASDMIPFLQQQKVDLILADIRTEDNEISLDYLAEAKGLCPDAKVIIMTGLPEISFIDRAKEVGADSFLYKNVSTAEFIAAIRKTMEGEKVYPGSKEKPKKDFIELSETEERILRLFCEGYERKEIADLIFLSENTVKFHVRKMLARSGFSSLSRMAIFAVSNGYIVLGNEGEALKFNHK